MRRRTLSIPIALVAFGCSSLTPSQVVGTYTLATIDGGAPPVVDGGTGGCTLLLSGGRLTLIPNEQGWSDLVLVRQEDCRAVDGGVTTDSLRYLGIHWLEDERLTFQTQLSLEDTLRFSGPFWLGGVTLTVRDTARGVGEHLLRFF